MGWDWDELLGAASTRWTTPARITLLVLCDLAALCAAGTLAYLIWALPVHHMRPGTYLALWPTLALFVLGYAQAGLYPGFGLGPVETFRRLSLVTLLTFVILAAVTFAFKLPHQYSRMTFGLAFLLAIVSVPALRFVTHILTRRLAWWRQPVVLIGTSNSILRAILALRESPLIGYRPIGILARHAEQEPSQIAGLPVQGRERASEVAEHGVTVAIIDRESLVEQREVDALQQHFRHLFVIEGYASLPVEGVHIRNLGGVLGVEFSNNLLQPRNRWVKRALDLGLGLALLLLTWPLVIACGWWVKARSPGPALYFQERAGLKGRRFLVPKIRTMQPNADEDLGEHLASDPIMRGEWEQRFKLRSDPRVITGVGTFLRRWSLDELPQLWSVVRGDMSLVGPRPFPDYHLERFSSGTRSLRQRVRPGITGLWQVTLRGDSDVPAQEAADRYYIRNWSVWLDLYILAKTVAAVISGRGAY